MDETKRQEAPLPPVARHVPCKPILRRIEKVLTLALRRLDAGCTDCDRDKASVSLVKWGEFRDPRWLVAYFELTKGGVSRPLHTFLPNRQPNRDRLNAILDKQVEVARRRALLAEEVVLSG